MHKEELLSICTQVLKANNRGDYTIPSKEAYPHQWLWDSCFTAIGLRHIDITRAQKEILSLLRGQWSNGMIPHMILSDGLKGDQARSFWRSNQSLQSPDNVDTSGITQPPLIAEAVVRIGEKLSRAEKHSWYQRVFPGILSFHEWLYADRDPHNEGLVVQLHPWETGLDNTPSWMYELHQHQMPTWIHLVGKLHLERLFNLARMSPGIKYQDERVSTLDNLSFYSIQRRLRRKRYDTQQILSHAHLAIEDVVYNSIFIRNNHHLKTIAKSIKITIPPDLLKKMNQSEQYFEQLWDAYSGQYYSRNFVTHKLIKVPTIGTLLPLYAGHITQERAQDLVKLLHDQKMFKAKFPVPTVPVKSEWFKAHGYWQGPTWINMNWMIIDGLKRYGFNDEAEALKENSLRLVLDNKCYEYFSPIDGSPGGVGNFSWTAALTIDLLS